MSAEALAACLAIGHAHARLSRLIENDLGAFHGLGFGDFVLLHRLGSAPAGRLAMPELASALGMSLSALTRAVIPLEKIGLVMRDTEKTQSQDQGRRDAVIHPAGQRLMQEATLTVGAICSTAMRAIEVDRLRDLQKTLSALHVQQARQR